MRTIQLLTGSALALLLLWPATALGHGRSFVSLGVNVGGPPCRHWGYGGPWGCGWYRPYPVFYYNYYVPPPPRVIVEAAPVVLQPAAPSPQPFPSGRGQGEGTPAGVTPVAAAGNGASGNVEHWLPQLADADERSRQNAVQELGRIRAERTVDPLAATLAGDASPAVREAAARALGLIASARALPALTRAAQADPDRDVRRSAQFAVEVIHSRLRER